MDYYSYLSSYAFILSSWTLLVYDNILRYFWDRSSILNMIATKFIKFYVKTHTFSGLK